MRPRILETLRQTLRPEFLNRIDDVVVFRPLGREEIGAIVKIQVAHLAKRLADRRITLELTPPDRGAPGAARATIPTFGARPLKRTIQRRLQDPLALRLLNGDFVEGDTVLAGAQGGDIVFTKRVEAHAV